MLSPTSPVLPRRWDARYISAPVDALGILFPRLFPEI
jgi:hypothetical protein